MTSTDSTAETAWISTAHRRIWIETIRDVAPGEELAYDYAYVLEERHTPAAKRRFPCHCGAATCRGTILAKKR